MREIRDIKKQTHEKQVLEILKDCQYNPTEEKMQKLAEEYANSPNTHVLGLFDEGILRGVTVINLLENGNGEITGIAVDPSYRKSHIGHQMIIHAADLFRLRSITAETDDDAVGFYRSCGFAIINLGEKYPGVIRYQCKLRI